ncbi:diaminopimelate epimerase [Actinomadura rifamycini]|uniref:diaminopimelate epimerase n=1 Tax=Actinomadura rifamycini TaxID=31962 RepID=UPI00047A082C|nr:diaminopimelate epimerase [Actinomadura rifamycini]
MSQLPVVKVHGNRNDILVVDGAPDELFPGGEAARAVRRLCDRPDGLGADGVYFIVDGGDGTARAWFFNPDGSESLLCGNGMRGAGRLLLDRHDAGEVVLRTGPYDFTVRDAGTTPHGVRRTAVELPPVDFAPADPIVAGAAEPVVDRVLGAYHASLPVTAVAVPNSHLVSVIGGYREDELIETGLRVGDARGDFPQGANVSFVLPLDGRGPADVYVQTYERGAGLTPSCGSGVAASRAVWSRLGRVDPDVPVLVRNPGGPARSWLQEADGRWQPVLEGNGTIVFRAEVDRASLAGDGPLSFVQEDDEAELAAFDALYRENREILADAGVKPTA